MKQYWFFFFPLTCIFLACSDDKTHFELDVDRNPAKYQVGEQLNVSVENPQNLPIDSVVYFYGKSRLGKKSGSEEFSTTFEKRKLGKHALRAKIYSEGKLYEPTTEVTLLHNKKPMLYTYKIINSFPHDKTAYTQGLEFYKDTLYESTGHRGASSLRKVDYKTGRVLKKFNLPDQYFGEGISILNDKIFMLTWQAGKGFVHDVHSFETLETFDFDKSEEGWGLTNDGEKLYKSDGTEKIWLLNPETFEEESYIQTVTNRGITTKLNELEWVEGKIYANTYLKDGVVIIDPKTGAIEGLIDFRGLREKVSQHPQLDVLNGIAYNPNTKKLYVTGKNWDKLFEVEIVEK